MGIDLYPHQKEAINNLKSGAILCGGVGTGKSRTALAYFFVKECGGLLNGRDYMFDDDYIPMTDPMDLYIITTARKRDTHEWEEECAPFLLSKDPEESFYSTKLVIDSWNNISKYVNVSDSFFIFDEQRLVGSGTWVKAFLKIAKSNRWLLLSATPGDTWMDYIPVFVANGFYKNRTEFIRRHVVYSRFAKFPKVDHYVEQSRLKKLRQKILVNMEFRKNAEQHHEYITTDYNNDIYKKVAVGRWNVFKDAPIKDISELCYTLRKITNLSIDRRERLYDIYNDKKRLIVFYNYDYELAVLRDYLEEKGITYSEWNGHKHEAIPETDSWIFLVQYAAGSEGWNCTLTDTIVFYSQSYSYKATVQAAGRIDRLNTPYDILYYYHFISNSSIDKAIRKALANKRNFNEKAFSENGYFETEKRKAWETAESSTSSQRRDWNDI